MTHSIDPETRLASDQRRQIVLLSGVLAAAGISLLVATQNYFMFAARGRPISWLALFMGEIPVWIAWLAMLPAITWLASRFPPHRANRLRNSSIHLLAGCAAVYVMLVFTEGTRRLIPGTLTVEGSLWAAVNHSYPRNLVPFLIVYAAAAALAIAWQYHWALQAQQIRQSQLQAQLARTRLDVLRAQIQPPFLFNTLHAISALMARDVNGARSMMRRLSELLRIALDESEGDEVPLEREIEFLDRYGQDAAPAGGIRRVAGSRRQIRSAAPGRRRDGPYSRDHDAIRRIPRPGPRQNRHHALNILDPFLHDLLIC